MKFPVVGRTNLIFYPRAYLLPEDRYLDDGELNKNYVGEPTDQNSFIYGVDQDNRLIFARFDYRIQQTTVTPEGELSVKLGDSIRQKPSNGKPRVLASVQSFSDITKPNYFCTADLDNDRSKNRLYSVILLSKIHPLSGDDLLKAQELIKTLYHGFMDTHGLTLSDVVFIDCGYMKVLNHGVDKRPEMAQFKKMQIGRAASPLFGIGRLELMVTKPSKQTVANAVLRGARDQVNNVREATNHIDTYQRNKMRHIQLKTQKRQAEQNGENTEALTAEINSLRETINALPSVGLIRAFSISLAAYASWGEHMSKLRELRELYVSEKGQNPVTDEYRTSQISEISLHCDKLAIENGFASFRSLIFFPDEVVRVKFTPNDLCFYIDKFFTQYTASGSYGGAYLRVMDRNGLVIPKLGYYFECRWQGEGKVSTAYEAYSYFSRNTDTFKLIQQYLDRGMYFELVPFRVTGASKKDATDYLSKYWLGDGNLPAMREFFYDPIHDEGINTYIAVSRRKTVSQADSEFMASIAPTGPKGAVPNELAITSDVNKIRKIRNRK
ncbi:hypothetical protein ACTG16_21410 [Aeromonas sp. 23P]|uniref:hypothetical protein n=1 Tax=Aeromonas sp. 23P TaxID=3452716 RepID=UPI003F7A3741